METINLVWFKKDLRTYDHEALNAALESEIVIPIFVVEPDLWKLPDHSSRQWEFVQVVGHVQDPEREKDPFISVHIIEPAYQPLNGFEPMEETENNLGDPYADVRRELDDPYADMRGELKVHHADIQKFFQN